MQIPRDIRQNLIGFPKMVDWCLFQLLPSAFIFPTNVIGISILKVGMGLIVKDRGAANAYLSFLLKSTLVPIYCSMYVFCRTLFTMIDSSYI